MLRRHLAKILRYASVSGVATGTSLTVLGILVGLLGVPAGWANVTATAAGTVPSFELNRRWVWRKNGRRSLSAEVVPFTILSFTGLAISTIAVHAAGTWAAHRGWPSTGRTLLILSTNVTAYGSLWVWQFLLLDRVLFRPDRPTAPEGGEGGEGAEVAEGAAGAEGGEGATVGFHRNSALDTSPPSPAGLAGRPG